MMPGLGYSVTTLVSMSLIGLVAAASNGALIYLLAAAHGVAR